MTTQDRTCRRCLLYEMAESAEYRNLYAYIEGLEEESAPPKIYMKSGWRL